MKHIDKFVKLSLSLAIFLLCAMMVPTGCSEDIDESNLLFHFPSDYKNRTQVE